MSENRPAKRDLSEFKALGKKRNWDERARLIDKHFPSAMRLNWDKAMTIDIDLMGELVRDVIKLDQAAPGRPGPRPSLDPAVAVARLRQLMGDDFTCLPFVESVKLLSGGRSGRQLAKKAGIERNLMQRVLSGQVAPDAYVLTAVASAFGKRPSFFLEYRQLYVATFILDALERAPEGSIALYRRIVRAEKQREAEE